MARNDVRLDAIKGRFRGTSVAVAEAASCKASRSAGSSVPPSSVIPTCGGCDEVVDAAALIVDMEAELARLSSRNGPDLSTIGSALSAGVRSFQVATKWRLANHDARRRPAPCHS